MQLLKINFPLADETTVFWTLFIHALLIFGLIRSIYILTASDGLYSMESGSLNVPFVLLEHLTRCFVLLLLIFADKDL